MQSSVSLGGAAVPAILVDGLPASQSLATPDGWVEARYLAPGDPVLTFENGEMPVAAAFRSTQTARVPRCFWPVLLPAGVMGNDHPVELLPAQMVMLESELAEDLYGEPFVMVPALALLGWNGITRRAPREMDMVHLQFDTPQVVFAGPCLLLGCGGTGNTAANLFRASGMTTLGMKEARQLVTGLIHQAQYARYLPPAQAAFTPAAWL